MEQPLISVIVPIYNVSKYLTRCLDSIKDQTYKNIEIICVNDGSTDNSGEIVETYLKDKRFKLFTKENGGLFSALNVGLDHASGKYICFVDSDDYVSDYFIEVLFNNIGNKNVCACQFTKQAGQLYNGGEYDYKTILYSDFLNYLETKPLFFASRCNKIYKANLFEKYRFSTVVSEDFRSTIELFEKNDEIQIVNCCLYFYTYNESSLTNNHKDYHWYIIISSYCLASIKSKKCKNKKICSFSISDAIDFYKVFIRQKEHTFSKKAKHEIKHTIIKVFFGLTFKMKYLSFRFLLINK